MADAADLRVVVSIKPVHSLVAGVMAGVGEPVLLLSGFGSPHAYSFRPSEAQILSQADLVFWVGEGLETFLIKPLQAFAPDAIVIELAAADNLTRLAARTGGLWDEDAHEEHAAAEHAEDHEDLAHAEGDHEEESAQATIDMHLWLDPRNAAAMVEAIAAALSQADAGNAGHYEDNAARLRAELDRLDQRLAATLAPASDRPFVVFHDAYQYFERRYGLNALGSITVSPERPPGAQRLREIQARLAELGAACVFAEPQFEPALVATVVEGTKAGTGVLDPEGASYQEGPELYFELMDGLAESLVGCLGGANSG